MAVRGNDTRRLELAAEVGDRVGEMANRYGLDSRKRRLGRRLRRAEDSVEPGAPRPLGGDQHAADGPHAPVESQLADRGVLLEPRNRNLVRGGEHRERDRQVEARSLLAQRRRREIDDDPLPPARPLELGGDDPAADALLRLLAGAVRQPDDREAGNPALQMGLHLDAAGVEPDEGMRDGSCEHDDDASPEIRARSASNRNKTVSYSSSRSLRHDASGERTCGCGASWRGSLSPLESRPARLPRME